MIEWALLQLIYVQIFRETYSNHLIWNTSLNSLISLSLSYSWVTQLSRNYHFITTLVFELNCDMDIKFLWLFPLGSFVALLKAFKLWVSTLEFNLNLIWSAPLVEMKKNQLKCTFWSGNNMAQQQNSWGHDWNLTKSVDGAVELIILIYKSKRWSCTI